MATKYVALGYDADSRLTGVSYFVPGTTNVIAASTYSYDHASRLTDLSYVDGSNNCLASYEWTYDNDSRVTQEESSADATIGSSWGVTNYGYDDDSQLTSTTYSTTFANAPTADTNSSPSYDSNGNRTNNGAAGSGNRLLRDGTYDYTDADGNRIEQTTISTGGVFGAYSWNNDNQLTEVASSLAQGFVDYGYDAFGRMVSRSIPNPQGTQNYIYDGQEIVLVLNVSGQVMQRNLYGPAVDQVLATETVTPGNSPQAAGPVNWYLTDNQGTVRDVVQFNGTATIEKDHLVYDSFGQITSQSSATDQPTFTSYGLWQDPTTAIDKTATRWYTAVDAVFLSQDPTTVSLSGQTNLSEYCGNSPTNCIDATGLRTRECGRHRQHQPAALPGGFARHRCRRPRQRGTVLHAGRAETGPSRSPSGSFLVDQMQKRLRILERRFSDRLVAGSETDLPGRGNFYGGSSPHGIRVVGGEAMFGVGAGGGWSAGGSWTLMRGVGLAGSGFGPSVPVRRPQGKTLDPEHTDTGTTAKGGRCSPQPQRTQQYLEKCPWT